MVWVGWYRVMGFQWIAGSHSFLGGDSGRIEAMVKVQQVVSFRQIQNKIGSRCCISFVVLPARGETPTKGGLLERK